MRMIEQDSRRRIMERDIHLAALPGQFHMISRAVHLGNPLGVTFRAGDTHSATFCGFCFLTSFPVSECESWDCM